VPPPDKKTGLSSIHQSTTNYNDRRNHSTVIATKKLDCLQAKQRRETKTRHKKSRTEVLPRNKKCHQGRNGPTEQ